MAAESVVIPVASTSSVRTAEAIRSPLRALVRRSVLSALGITVRQHGSRPSGDLRRPAEGYYYIRFLSVNQSVTGSIRAGLAIAEQALEFAGHRRRGTAAFERIGDLAARKPTFDPQSKLRPSNSRA